MYSLNRYLLNAYYVPGITLGFGEAGATKKPQPNLCVLVVRITVEVIHHNTKRKNFYER